jgi:hypothetical protein
MNLDPRIKSISLAFFGIIINKKSPEAFFPGDSGGCRRVDTISLLFFGPKTLSGRGSKKLSGQRVPRFYIVFNCIIDWRGLN